MLGLFMLRELVHPIVGLAAVGYFANERPHTGVPPAVIIPVTRRCEFFLAPVHSTRERFVASVSPEVLSQIALIVERSGTLVA